MIDEVDLVLHPLRLGIAGSKDEVQVRLDHSCFKHQFVQLRSELNFPIGPKNLIDFAPHRWQIPLHLLEGIFISNLSRKKGVQQA